MKDFFADIGFETCKKVLKTLLTQHQYNTKQIPLLQRDTAQTSQALEQLQHNQQQTQKTIAALTKTVRWQKYGLLGLSFYSAYKAAQSTTSPKPTGVMSNWMVPEKTFPTKKITVTDGVTTPNIEPTSTSSNSTFSK